MTDPVLLALLAMQRHSWEQGVASHALLDLGRTDLARLLALDAVVHQSPDGRLGTVGEESGSVNGAACGEALIDLPAPGPGATPPPTGVRGLGGGAPAPGGARAVAAHPALAAQLDWLLARAPRAADGTLFHVIGSREVWADTVYMVVPLLAAAGHPGEAVRQVAGHRERLCGGGLYAARWDEDTAALTAPEHWGTGSGWVAAGIARALRHDPSLEPALAGHAREIVDACLALRRPDGLFGNVLDDPASFPEANVAQMLAYTTCAGVADGWLPPSYAAVGRSLIAAVAPLVTPDGLVTGVCGAPVFDRPGTSAEAQSFYLMARAAAARLPV
ncbi:glycoside hydrolase family 88 protein [Dactylosporangium sp. NPDC050588]|uniref:glycoside hydrolase family 88 protein n=1 Tax=Dactylosporangium sp. NPDC050588 TaxID=3157211 RepID=UPI0033F54A1E